MAGNALALTWDLIARDGASPVFERVSVAADKTAASTEAASAKTAASFSTMAKVGAAAGLAFAAAATKMAADFQKQMTLVQTQAGASAAEVKKMTPAVLSLAGKTAQAPEALATSLYHVESTGLRGAQALNAVKIAAEGARVGNADLEETTNALTATIASGMLPATETYAQAMGQLNTIVGAGDMKMSDLNEALASGLLVTTKQYGVTINDVGAALADFGDNNIRGADAATSLRMAVQSIAKPGVGAAAALGKIGLTVEELQSDEQTGGLNKALTDLHTHLVNSGIASTQWGQLMVDAFTKKAGGGITTLIGTYDRFEQKYKEVQEGAGSFGDAWAATEKTAAFQAAALKDNIDAMAISVGEHLLPIATGAMSFLNHDAVPALQHLGSGAMDAAHWFGALPAPIKDVTVALAGMGIANAVGLTGRLALGLGAIRDAVVSVRSGFGGLGDEIRIQQQLGAMQAAEQNDVTRALGLTTAAVNAEGDSLTRVQMMLRGYDTALAETAVAQESAAVKSGGFSTALSTIGLRAESAAATGLKGIVAALGGPVGIGLGATILAATTVIPDLVHWLSETNTVIPKVTVSTQSLTSAIQANSGAIDQNVRKQAAQALQQAGLFKAAQQWGISTETLTNAALGQKDAIQQVTLAADAYKNKMDATAQSTAVQADQSGIAADAYKKAAMQSDSWLQSLEKTTGIVAGTIDQQRALAQAVYGTADTVDGLKSALTQMGLTSDTTWANNVATINGATAAEIQDLKNLGLTVKTLPNGNISVSADTQSARNSLSQLTNDYANYSINLGVKVGSGHFAAADGGILPGYSPGRDVHTFTSPSGGTLSLSGGEAIMRPEFTSAVGVDWISAMNQAARTAGVAGVRSALGFAGGGVMPMYLTAKVGISPAALNAAESAIPSLVGQAMTALAGVPVASSANIALGQQLAAARGWVGADWLDLLALWNRESGWRNTAQNPTSTAYGIPQLLDGTWASTGYSKSSDPRIQILAGENYIAGRYDNPVEAWSHEIAYGWYDGGGYLPPGMTMAFNGTGKRETVRTAEQESALSRPVNVQVFIGNREITDIVDTRISYQNAAADRSARSSL